MPTKLTFAQCLDSLMGNVRRITDGQIVGGRLYLYTWGPDKEATSIVEMVVTRHAAGLSLDCDNPSWGTETDTVEFRVYNYVPGHKGLINDWMPAPEILKYQTRTAAKDGYLKLVAPQIRMCALKML